MKHALLAFLFFTACAHVNGNRFIDGPQGKLHVDDGGSGSALPVLFVHGNGANAAQWRYQLAHLRTTRRAIAFDLRGMGQSEPARNGDYSVKAMADDVAAVVDALQLKRFVIVGHSFGGAPVATYIAAHPDRVAGAVFVDAAGGLKVTDEAAAAFLGALRKDKDGVVQQWFAPILANASDAVKSEVYASVAKTPIEPFVGALSGLRSYDPIAAMSAYHGPVLAIAPGGTDNPGSMQAQIAGMRVERIEGVSHWLMLDKPDDFTRILDRFLSDLSR